MKTLYFPLLVFVWFLLTGTTMGQIDPNQHLLSYHFDIRGYHVKAPDTIDLGPLEITFEVLKAKNDTLVSVEQYGCPGDCDFVIERGFRYFIHIGTLDYKSQNLDLDLSGTKTTLVVFDDNFQDSLNLESPHIEIRMENLPGMSVTYDYFNRFLFERNQKTLDENPKDYENMFLLIHTLKKQISTMDDLIIKVYTDDDKRYKELGWQKALIVQDILVRNGIPKELFHISTLHLRERGVRPYEIFNSGRSLIFLSPKYKKDEEKE